MDGGGHCTDRLPCRRGPPVTGITPGGGTEHGEDRGDARQSEGDLRVGRRDERRARVHSDLLDAARRTVEESGAQALTMRGLAADLGYSAPVVYQHFADRQAVLDAVAAEGFRLLAEHLTAAVVAQPSARSGPEALTVAYLAEARENPRLMDLMHSPQVTPAARADAAQGVEEITRSAVLAWADAHEIDLGPGVEEAEVLWALAQGLTTIDRITTPSAGSADGADRAAAAVLALTAGWLQRGSENGTAPS
jgi:AcrR family transcriptional regulator